MGWQIRQKLKDYGVEGVENITVVPDAQHEGRSRGFAFLELDDLTILLGFRCDFMPCLDAFYNHDVVGLLQDTQRLLNETLCGLYQVFRLAIT